RVRRQVVGVGDPRMAPKMAQMLAAGGAEHVMVVHGASGLDELSTPGVSVILEYWAEGPEDVDRARAEPAMVQLRTTEVDPTALGLARADLSDLLGGDAPTNATLVRQVLHGHHGPHRDIVLLNAAAGLVVGGAAADLAEGVDLAARSIDTGRAAGALDRLIEVSRREAAL